MAGVTTGSELTAEQARKLLAPMGDVEIEAISRAATINGVFEVATRSHGKFYVKFHTARWYADQPDTFFVVNREIAVPELLRKRGLPLPYPVWGDFTRCVVPRSVLICGDLGGVSVPDAVRDFPDETNDILAALGRYLRRLHDIEFSTPGLIEPAHAYFARESGPIPPVVAWPMDVDPAEEDQANALNKVAEARAAGAISTDTADALLRLFSNMAETVRPGYQPPRFTVGNCHVHHFHVERTATGWRVRGFYDFEGARAGDPIMDLVGIEDTLVPRMRSFAWRRPFFEGYGSWPDFDAFKMRLFSDTLLSWRCRSPGNRIPDHPWLDQRWPTLIHATDFSELIWYLPTDSRQQTCPTMRT